MKATEAETCQVAWRCASGKAGNRLTVSSTLVPLLALSVSLFAVVQAHPFYSVYISFTPFSIIHQDMSIEKESTASTSAQESQSAMNKTSPPVEKSETQPAADKNKFESIDILLEENDDAEMDDESIYDEGSEYRFAQNLHALSFSLHRRIHAKRS